MQPFLLAPTLGRVNVRLIRLAIGQHLGGGRDAADEADVVTRVVLLNQNLRIVLI